MKNKIGWTKKKREKEMKDNEFVECGKKLKFWGRFGLNEQKHFLNLKKCIEFEEKIIIIILS